MRSLESLSRYSIWHSICLDSFISTTSQIYWQQLQSWLSNKLQLISYNRQFTQSTIVKLLRLFAYRSRSAWQTMRKTQAITKWIGKAIALSWWSELQASSCFTETILVLEIFRSLKQFGRRLIANALQLENRVILEIRHCILNANLPDFRSPRVILESFAFECFFNLIFDYFA